MATIITNYLRPPKAPNLAVATTEYEQRYQDQLNNQLRIYFNELDNAMQTLLGSGAGGGKFIRFPYGAFQDTAYTTLNGAINNSVTTITVVSTTGFPTSGQIRIDAEVIIYTGTTATTFTGCTRGARGTANSAHLTGATVTKIQAPAASTATVMSMNTTDYANDMSLVDTSKMTVTSSGIYNLQWSGQFNNSDTSLHDISVWIRVDGVDIPGSTGFASIPNSHGGIDGHAIVGWNYFVSLEASQYVELWWSSTNQSITLECYAPQTSPTRPSTASVIATLSFVSALPT
jgi:hypothetical protein